MGEGFASSLWLFSQKSAVPQVFNCEHNISSLFQIIKETV